MYQKKNTVVKSGTDIPLISVNGSSYHKLSSHSVSVSSGFRLGYRSFAEQCDEMCLNEDATLIFFLYWSDCCNISLWIH
jgi:hypothetical protein